MILALLFFAELTKTVSKAASVRCEQILQGIENWENLMEQYCCRLEIVRQNKKNSLKAAVKRLEDQDLPMSEVGFYFCEIDFEDNSA